MTRAADHPANQDPDNDFVPVISVDINTTYYWPTYKGRTFKCAEASGCLTREEAVAQAKRFHKLGRT